MRVNAEKITTSFFLHSYLESAGWSAASLADFLAKQTADSARFPRDDEFERKWDTPVYTSLRPGRARAILTVRRFCSDNRSQLSNSSLP